MVTIRTTFKAYKDKFVAPKDIKAKYPDMHFLFAEYKDSRIMGLEGEGYEVVRPTEEMKKNHPKLYKDDMIKVGDTVLMMCPLEQYKQREIDKEVMCSSLSMNKKESIRENVEKLGATVTYKGKGA